MRQADLHDTRFGRVGENKIKSGMKESGTFRDDVATGVIQVGALEEIVSDRYGDLVENIFPDDVNFAKDSRFEPWDVMDGEGIFPGSVKRLQGKRFQLIQQCRNSEPEVDCEMFGGGRDWSGGVLGCWSFGLE